MEKILKTRESLAEINRTLRTKNGNLTAAQEYLNTLIDITDENGRVPKLYYSKTAIPNDNNPLGWSCAITIIAIDKYLASHGN